jgi:hypothetical protein
VIWEGGRRVLGFEEGENGEDSRKDPGQPCKKRMGIASGRDEKRDIKWILKVSFPSWMGRVNCGKELMCSSHLRLVHFISTHIPFEVRVIYQSKLWSQYSLASVSHLCVMPYLPPS